jgi:hypothetical protein
MLDHIPDALDVDILVFGGFIDGPAVIPARRLTDHVSDVDPVTVAFHPGDVDDLRTALEQLGAGEPAVPV